MVRNYFCNLDILNLKSLQPGLGGGVGDGSTSIGFPGCPCGPINLNDSQDKKQDKEKDMIFR